MPTPLSHARKRLHQVLPFDAGEFRVLDNIGANVQAGSPHPEWLLAQGYQSSFTLQMYGNGGFLGFVYFDSLLSAGFRLHEQRDLLLFCRLINMAISDEMSAIRAVLASARIASDFAKLRDFETGAPSEPNVAVCTPDRP